MTRAGAVSSRGARAIAGRYPYVFVDAKIEKVRDGGRVARKCVVVAHAVHETSRREIIGLDVGEAEPQGGAVPAPRLAWGNRRSRRAGYR